jgi:hypothetical protein
MQFSPLYDAGQNRILEKFKARLAAYPDLKKTIAAWPRMRRRDQTSFLERCAATLADIQSEGGITVYPAAIRWRDDKAFGTALGLTTYDLMNDPDGARDLIELRADGRMGSNDIAETLDTLVHEQTHIYQAFLARAALSEKMDKMHPLYEDAALAAFSLLKGYVPSELPAPYRAQCVERDAFRAGHIARDFMKAARRQILHESDRNNPHIAAAAIVGIAFLAGRALLGTQRRTL